MDIAMADLGRSPFCASLSGNKLEVLMLIEGRTRAGLLEPLGGFRLLTDDVDG